MIINFIKLSFKIFLKKYFENIKIKRIDLEKKNFLVS